MSDNRVPDQIADLLWEHVQTYEQLETLVLLGRDPDGRVSETQLAAALAISASSAAETLGHLHAAGLLEMAGEEYGCPAGRRDLLRRLAEVHRDDRIQVMTLMTNNALERVRTSALRAFSRAFLFGRKRDG